MILQDFIIQNKQGLYCAYGDFYLDPKEPAKHAVVSHGHGDHAYPENGEVYCTATTEKVMRYRYKEEAARTFKVKAYHETFELNGVQITFIPAGHILGSAQVLMVHQGIRYLYTGDFKLQPDATCEPFEFVLADVLITETTFANPATIHPPAAVEVRKLNDVKSNVMIGAYVLGKSQRLIHLINQHCLDRRVLIHYSLLPFIKLYEQAGIDFGKYELFDKRALKSANNIAYIVPPMVFNSNIKLVNAVKIFATGWKSLQSGNAVQLHISDHADWAEIIETIEKVKPTEIWTTHGDGDALQAHFEGQLRVKILNP